MKNGKVIRLTESDLHRIIKRVILESPKKDPIGQNWQSCQQWNSKSKSEYGKFFNFTKTNSLIEIMYNGPKSGISIAHSKGGKADTIHQVFNVLMCELNPYLAKINAKPDIYNIYYETSQGGATEKEKDFYGLTISIPLLESDKPYQIERRGGWGHRAESGLSDMKSKCENNSKCNGPKTHEFKGEFGTITEHFITLPL